MRRAIILGSIVWALAGVTAPALATHNADIHSPNLSLIAKMPEESELADIAFWGDTAVMSIGHTASSTDDGVAILDISNPAAPREISRFRCPESHYDVGIWGTLVFLSLSDVADKACEPPVTGGGDGRFGGIQIVSIADPHNPVQLASVELCENVVEGSHTHTIVPDLGRGRLLLYNNMQVIPHSGCEEIVEVPLADPSKARRIATIEPVGRGCHDLTVLLEKNLAAGACGDSIVLWDIKDPAAPQFLSRTANPLGEYMHTTLFSADGKTLVAGDETTHVFFGAPPPTDCAAGTPNPQGSLYFYDITEPRAPIFRSYLQAQHRGAPGYCTAHQFNLVPRRDDRDVLVAGWFSAGAVVVDFTDPRAPKQIGHYVPIRADEVRPRYWSAYFYRDHIYATSSNPRGLDVFAVNDPAFEGAIRLPYLNAQTQEPYPAPGGPPPPAPGPPAGQPGAGPPPASKPAAKRKRAKRRCVRVKRGRKRASKRGRKRAVRRVDGSAEVAQSKKRAKKRGKKRRARGRVCRRPARRPAKRRSRSRARRSALGVTDPRPVSATGRSERSADAAAGHR